MLVLAHKSISCLPAFFFFFFSALKYRYNVVRRGTNRNHNKCTSLSYDIVSIHSFIHFLLNKKPY